MKHQVIHFNKLKPKKISATLERKMAVGQNAMLLEHRVKKGHPCPVNESHENEQFTLLLQGKIRVQINKETMLLGPGDLIVIPPNVVHTLEILEDAVLWDVFSPVRKEWID